MAEDKVFKDPITGAQTTGHVWDDNLMEFNNPLPTWWLWAFYASFVFAIVYWFLYPAWPTGLVKGGFTTGVSTVTFQNNDGTEVTTGWNSRAKLAYELQNDEYELKRNQYVQEIAATSYDDIAKDPNKVAFINSYGKGIFGDYCAACHQSGANGVVGLYPNLIDDDWLWGGDTTAIESTIRHGRNGYMPAFKKTFNDTQLTEVANYVLSLSGVEHDAAAAAKGSEIFNGETGGCYYCHTKEGKGLVSQGSANLTDKIWTIANVPAADNKLEAVKQVIYNGVNRQMPAWGSRLSDDEIKVLVAYLRQKAAN
ncbi:MAG TPA: cytochrome-c oxidase, cbb3-type subunit III [Thiothrix sp.]|nr:cytochrome-c oxidase, cbb3-type subunit III [Thiothrix sp.]